MKISVIKQLNEKTPYWMKKPFSAIIRKQLISNKIFKTQYQELESTKGYSNADLLAKVKEILIHAYEHTIYYHKLFDDIHFSPQDMKDLKELDVIPLLTKEILQKEYGKLSADNIHNYYEVTTGGTTGKPTKVLMSKDAIYREWAFVYHYWSKYGYDYKKSRLATLRGVDFDGKLHKYNPLYAEIRLNPFLMSDKNIQLYIKKIKKYRAEFLYGYPSAVYNFCRLSLKKGISIDNEFKAVFLISENLYPHQKKLIEKVTGAPIAIFYGHSERAVFAEKEETGYVFNPLYGLTEINDNNEIITTGFINLKMPLIRYTVDDSAKKIDNRYYEIIGHHTDDLLYGNDGVQISMAAINFHDDTFEGVEAYQFVQDQIGRCELNIVSDSLADIEKIYKSVQKKLGNNIQCTVKQAETIQYTQRGKYKMVIQRCK